MHATIPKMSKSKAKHLELTSQLGSQVRRWLIGTKISDMEIYMNTHQVTDRGDLALKAETATISV